jgi:hypothetical protein
VENNRDLSLEFFLERNLGGFVAEEEEGKEEGKEEEEEEEGILLFCSMSW